jgi:hypothetical protein
MNYEPVKGLPDMPEFGMLFKLSADFDQLTWYGLGPEETYADRKRGGKLSVHSNEVKDICINDLDDEDEVETEEYSSGHEKEHEELMNKLYRAAFYAFSQVDFVDMVDMLNYRCVEFSKVGPRDKKDESLEAQYIENTPGNYEVPEIQKYVYEIVMESLNRFRDELDCGMLENDPEHLIGEYYNHSSGIYCRVLKNGVEISYMPINSFGDVDFDI